MDNYDADVIIVGAGPTGLMLAGELGLHGVSVTVLDRLAEPMRQSRALGFSARTIEEFGQRGLLSRLGDVDVIPVGHFGGVPLDYRVLSGGSYGARGIPQSRTEAMLAGWAAEKGARTLRSVEVTGVAQDGDGVTVSASGVDGGTLRARYVIGCDGARSTVRRAAGIDFPGTGPTVELRFADVSGVRLRPRFSGERVPGGMVMVLPLGPDRCRIIYYDRDEPLRAGTEPITFDEVAAAFLKLSGEDIHAATPSWVSSTTDVSRQAAAYRSGRVFVAGDAAHVHLPIGAQGMSAGVQDAVNLGWKLALVLAGQAPDALLDTYHAERHPVGARILTNTLAQRTLYLGGDEVTPLTDVFAELARYEPVQRRLVGMVTGLDIRHDVGPGAHPLLGRRMEDGELTADGRPTRVHALLHAGRGVLLDLGGDGALPDAAKPWADRVDTVRVGHGENLPEVDAILLRPDGYVAWIAPDQGGNTLSEALERWFGPAG
ncbi:putative monooxygenase [Actinacidiphila reveromycinica]|uniref:Putative monooxygenase n=1 Tax=Actinacidiphila reveromycinica TaxID=659352 RepID=A0A7U3UPN0_9ACTN|nr:FAD-dependent monooxygenase [Streptomyces sp. SN-593]BBA96382.1 putative monooxygenase [Streptomyces sp. SN-593]